MERRGTMEKVKSRLTSPKRFRPPSLTGKKKKSSTKVDKKEEVVAAPAAEEVITAPIESKKEELPADFMPAPAAETPAPVEAPAAAVVPIVDDASAALADSVAQAAVEQAVEKAEAPAPAPTAGPEATAPPAPEDKGETETDEYEIKVPAGSTPGQKLRMTVGNETLVVTVPPGAEEGSVISFQRQHKSGFAKEAAAALAEAAASTAPTGMAPAPARHPSALVKTGTVANLVKDFDNTTAPPPPPPRSYGNKVHPVLRWLAKIVCVEGCLMEMEANMVPKLPVKYSFPRAQQYLDAVAASASPVAAAK